MPRNRLYFAAMEIVDFPKLPLITGDINEIAIWLTSKIDGDGKTESPCIVTHINANNYYILCKQARLAHLLRENTQILFDGIGMKLAAYLLGSGWLPDLNGTDLFPIAMEKFVKDGTPIYLLGGEELVVLRAVQNIRSRWSQSCLVGYSSGYFTDDEEARIVSAINASGAKVLLVARGFPLQEAFTIRQRSSLKVSLIWNVGGLFDFISQSKPRAPLWMRQLRLEWLFRLMLEPHRLWHRTFVVGPWFATYILTQRYILFNKGLLNKEV